MIGGCLLDAGSGSILVRHVEKTQTFLERSRGLLGRGSLGEDQGLLITPCNSVHTFFMGMAIDVLFLDKDMRIIKLTEMMRPWQVSGCLQAAAVLELKAGEVNRKGLKKGRRVLWESYQ